MAKICLFCGKEIGRWKDQELWCGEVLQTVCEPCWDRYSKAPPIQRARLALETGRALEPERIQRFLEREEAAEAENARRRERQRQNLLCCGQAMTREEDYSFMDQTPFRFAVRTPVLRLFRCELCGQVKFFDAGFFAEEQRDVPLSPPAEGAAEPVKPVRLKPGQKPPWEK